MRKLDDMSRLQISFTQRCSILLRYAHHLLASSCHCGSPRQLRALPRRTVEHNTLAAVQRSRRFSRTQPVA